MNACFFYAVKMFDCASQFALQGLQIIDFVLKFRDAEFAVVKEFKAFVAARQSCRGQIQTQIVNLRSWNQDGRAFFVFNQLIRHARFFQVVYNVAGVFRLQIGIQRHIIGFGTVPKTDADESQNRGENRTEKNQLMSSVVPVPKFLEPLSPIRQ